MSMLLLIVVLILLFGWGGGVYMHYPIAGNPNNIHFIWVLIVIIIVVWLITGRHF